MQRNSEYNDQIERYLDDTLSATEKVLFDERLKADPILSKMLSSRIILQNTWVKNGQHKHIKAHINHLINIEKQEHKSRSTKWLVAASLIGLLGISSIFFVQHTRNQNDREFLAGDKILNRDKSEKFIQGQQNEIKKYGSVDSVETNKTVADNRYLPADRSVYRASDTILFTWPASVIKERLIIFDEKGSEVAELPLKTDAIEYKLLPSTLKPGSYTWTLPPNALKYQFSIRQ
ncbi:MAG TPA: hypothetical protein VFC67_26525 [Prolixibacteraceae bacterium]|nr:hypothetical protein [Prolixibacteraceae bacterium]